jgi:hypothetical protein
MKSAMTKMKANRWQFRLPWRCSGTTQGASPIVHIQGITGNYWMPPLGKCLRRIAPAAAMVNEFVKNKTLTKHNF